MIETYIGYTPIIENVSDEPSIEEIVEGYVENFEPMPYEGHAQESFDIEGVHFEYSIDSSRF